MGVPKFYRWVSERYPCLSEVVKEFQLPEFDNLYLDMNGIVHVCSHPEDDNPHFRITEEQIFKDICHYIEFLFRMIKPRKMFFMAIDGVAPRAKMNQQRGRRFRSAREAEDLIKRAQEKGEVLPTEKRFDSNCITPGTLFMKRLQDHLKYFVVSKVTHDPLWQGPKIILSGQETPGEGEHKIMDYIRYSRSQPDHDPNTRHCLYGLDADLIMLGLTSHEPHFALLREEVRFGGNMAKRPTTPEETTFHLLHLSLMREYLDYEFSELREKLSFAYDVEKVIDDWILMGFLVGNDFIPHLPHLHIHHDALPLLWKTYIEVLPTLDGYLNEGGHLNLKRFEKYIGALAKFDRDQFSEQYVDMKYLEGKRDVRQQDSKTNGASLTKQKLKAKDDNTFAVLGNMHNVEEEDLEEFMGTLDKETADDDEDEDDFDTFDAEFRAHKRDYYMTKLEFGDVTPEVLKSQAFEYVRAIQWILLYYYDGCQSWSWFYPHHYAPYISDVKDFSDLEITFEMSEPFRPFEQLMSVLPAASKELLPECLQELMTEETSPVIGYYPVDFKTDLNGKQRDWEAVVLIPFIDEEKLLSAIRSKQQYLSPEERQRNSHGPCYMYQYSPEHQGTYPSPMPGAFPDVAASHAKVVEIPKFHFCLPPVKICKGLLPGSMLDVYFPGFPTLKHIPHTHCLDKCGVKVFQHNSRGFNMILTILDPPEKPLEDIASDLLGTETWVGWPHLHEAKVFAIANEHFRIEIEEIRVKGQAAPTVQWKRKPVRKAELDEIYKDASAIREKYRDRFGVNVGKTAVVIYAGPMTGRKYVYTSHGQITIEKQFSSNTRAFVLQATCKDLLCHAPDNMSLRTLEELFPVGGAVFMLGHPHYGCQGEVLEVDRSEGRVRANFTILQEPDFAGVYLGQQVENDQYMPGYIAAQRLGIITHLFSRITGSVLILRGSGGNTESKANIGLNLKFTKRGEEKPGYTRKTDDGWLYSDKCVQIVGDYLQKFPDLWDYIATSATGGSDVYTEAELFPPEETEVSLRDVLKYLEELPCAKVTTMKTGADIVGDITIKAIEEAVEKAVEQNKKTQKKVKIFAKAHVLFRPLPNQGGLEPDPGTQFEMLDRVVVVKMGYSVPLGLCGTVVGIHPGETTADTLFDVIFDQDFAGGISLRCSSKRGYRVPAITMLNLSHGQRKLERQHPQPRAAWQQPLPPQLQQPSAPWQQQRPQHSPAGNRQGLGSYSGLMGQEWRRAGSNTMAPRQQSQKVGGYACPPPQQPPQFVTPRFASLPAKPVARVSPHRGPVPSTLPPSDTNDFTNIWNQLITSNASAGPLPKMPVTFTSMGDSQLLKGPHPASGESAAGSPQKMEVAATRAGPQQPSALTLDSAAQKLGSVALPSLKDLIDLGSKPEVPVDVLVDLTEASSQSRPGDQARPVGHTAPLTVKCKTPSASVKQKSGEEKGRTPSREKESGKRAGVRIITNSNLSQKGEKQKVENLSSNKIVDLFEKASRVHSGQSKSLQQSPLPSQGLDLNAKERSISPVITSDKVQAQKCAGSSSVSSEFNSMFAALQMVSKPATGEPDKAESAGAEASTSAVLKQLLKIGIREEERQERTGEIRQSYGRQLSVQELFEGAKQVPVPTPLVGAKSAAAAPVSAPVQQPPVQQPPVLQQHQPGSMPQQHRSQLPMNQPLLPLPSLLGAPPTHIQARNPVDDLRYICQLSGQGGPKFDISYQPKQKGFIASVYIPGGARFEGSMSQTKDDAAESAASVALLCLRQVGGPCPPWLLQPGPGMSMLRPGQRLFSPNSAFSPVPNQLPRAFGQPMFSQPPPNVFLPPRQRGSTPLLSQLPPPLSSIPLQVPPSVRPQQFPSPSTGHTNKEPGTMHGTTSPAAEGEKMMLATTKSSTEAFIPMQVTRKQRRKEENVEKVAASTSTHTSTSTQLPPSADCQSSSAIPKSPSVPTQSQDSANATVPLANSGLSTRDIDAAVNTSPLPQARPANKVEHGDTAGKMLPKEGPGDSERGSGKKRRPRIAANFGIQSH